MEFDATPPTAALEIMESEVQQILRASGVSLDWRLAEQNRGTESFAGLVVLKFKGACRADASPGGSDFGSLGESHPFGVTKMAHGHVLPYTEVECDEIRQALSSMASSAGRRERQGALGRMLGRVVAHELYHILARTTKHAADGLAKASQSFEDLISVRSLDFRDEDSRAIEAGLRSSQESAN